MSYIDNFLMSRKIEPEYRISRSFLILAIYHMMTSGWPSAVSFTGEQK